MSHMEQTDGNPKKNLEFEILAGQIGTLILSRQSRLLSQESQYLA